jgi:hypothetical protein
MIFSLGFGGAIATALQDKQRTRQDAKAQVKGAHVKGAHVKGAHVKGVQRS